MDRRTIIEDAAGVVKYKKRKEEALKKLDKTHDNLDRVNDIILELEQQVEPLREQSEKAKEYLENKNNLENLEIALLAYDIYNDSEEEKKLKQKLEVIEQKLVEENITSSNSDVKITEEQTRLTNKERKLKEANEELFKVVEEVEKLNAEKLLLQEKAKNKDISESEKKLRENLELEGNINSQIKILEDEIDKLNKNLNNKSGELISSEREIDDAKNRKKLSMLDYSNCDQQIITLTHKINGLKQEIENGTNIPNSIKKVLTNNNLTGIYNTIGNTLEIEDMYLKALETAIVSSRNFIITEDEESSKKAIRYLKEEHLGRATFFPLSVIKSRYVDPNTLFILKQEDSFLGILSDLVTYDKKYKNIIENQLGIVVVCKDINNAVLLGKKINHKYKIVTLDGDVINVGGSMTGGSSNTNSRSIVTIKQELTTYEDNKSSVEEDKERISNDIKNIDKEIEILESKYFEIKREEVNISEELKEKNKTLDGKKDLLSNVTRDISQLKNVVEDKVSEKETEIINSYYEKVSLRDTIKNNIDTLNREIDELKVKIENISAEYKIKSSNIRSLEKEKNEINISINRLEVKLDNMLNILNEDYSLTYEAARDKYSLEVEASYARERVNLYKNNIKRLGMVNLAAIEEYERVNTRYEFLCKQRDDLNNAEESLLEIMREMDGVIEEEFTNTYKKVNEEFTKVFKELFSGGTASLKLTDPDNMLTTGIDIVASPPGKKLSSITLLSGGEKTLTAISLLFAILNVREVPFCLFDEVEAALDEANVDQFGRYLEHYKNKTQFLIITHKKKTMEYADTLYGITMQESGVSKLVSVKLNEHVDTV